MSLRLAEAFESFTDRNSEYIDMTKHSSHLGFYGYYAKARDHIKMSGNQVKYQ